MTYQEFIDEVEEKIGELTADDVFVCPLNTKKNNNVERSGIILFKEGESLSPTIYLEEYYERLVQGEELTELIEDILDLYEEIHMTPSWLRNDIRDYRCIEDIIVYKLISREANQELLEEIPHELFLDMAIVFYLLLDVGEKGTATIMVRGEQLQSWGVPVEEIYEKAQINTAKLLPARLRSMDAVIEEMVTGSKIEGEQEGEWQEDDMYVLSNYICNFGAAVILYDGMIEMILELLNDSFYVLPSSVHEMIIVPEKKSIMSSELRAMVREINETQVEPEEVLSNQVYYCDNKKEAKLKIVRHDISI